ncbi:unnamed protein product [Diatraea saccharalis]|uniref:Uncharacterized protein n=1 Tax=Diatraea saccharalis TaxID=40085 RepID=A0A9N9WJZ0_9NEOP|nr:unnamed protein product [Diatraea saccharalis]
MNVKKCTVEPKAEPPPISPCTLQKIKQLKQAGKTICPKEPIPEPEPAPECIALCIERIKNFPIPPTPNFPIVCVVDREETGTNRCDAIAYAEALQPDLPWPGCPPPPPLPPPPEINLCEVQKRKQRIEKCKESRRRYYP